MVLEVHYHALKDLPQIPVLIQLNPVHPISSISKTNFDIIVPLRGYAF
jgi:hypothetical protein